MGITFTTVKVRTIIADSEEVELRVKVDTGATMLVIPGWLQENLNFPVIRKQLQDAISSCFMYLFRLTSQRLLAPGT